MTDRSGVVRLLSGAASALLGLGLLAVAITTEAAAEPTAHDAAATTVTVRIDPSYQQAPFEGWGTSLVWMANATGGYPDEIRNKLVELLFGRDGLRLNIARYNIGGEDAPTTRKDYMKRGARMPGFWKADKPYGPNDKDWWDPKNPDHWNWDADANQRWWIDQIKDKVDIWEAFSNSPPWFQTVSGFVSGNFIDKKWQDQIREDKVDEFAEYLVRVTEHIEKAHGIEFDTIEPLNEPNTDYWQTTLGPDGQPLDLKGRQEGAYVSPRMQQKVILALKRRLATARTEAVVSAMDETNPGRFAENWRAYTDEAKAALDLLNVHTYGTGQRTTARDIAKGEHKKLWMSEVEGTYVVGTTDYTSMVPGLAFARHIVDDLRELEPAAWVLWQPVEDGAPQRRDGKNWGSIHVDFDCPATATLATCPIHTNTKFDTMRNFTHYIRPGDRVVKVDDPQTTAAVKKSGTGATVVHVNPDARTRAVTLDLSGFATISAGATVSPVVTSAHGKLVRGEPVQVTGTSVTVVVPAESVTTFVVDGVSGVAEDVALVQPGHVYRLQGVPSGKSVARSTDGNSAVIRTGDAANADQLWFIRKLTDGVTHRERYALVNAGNGKRLAVRDGRVVLEADSGADRAAAWMMSTTGDGTYTFVNDATGALLDVSGSSSAEYAGVAAVHPTSQPNQLFRVLDESVVRTQTVSTYTVPGRAPTLPETVTSVYRSGDRGTLKVTWQPPSADAWSKPGVVTVPGTVTDLVGREVAAKVEVTVDTFVATLPGRAKAYVGGQPNLPKTVVGLGRDGGRADLPVTWEEAAAGAFDKAGVVVLQGTAQVVDGTRLPATVRVQVTQPREVNAALDDGVSVSATYTESGYSAAKLRNGVTAEKAWSNWKSGTKNPSEAITFTLPEPRDVTRVVTHFHRDSSAGGGLAQSLRIQAGGTDGQCADVSTDVAVGTEGAPAVDVPVTAPAVKQVCVLLTPRSQGYLTLGEIEVFAKAAGASSDAAVTSIEVNGAPIDGFRPDRTGYRAVVERPDRASVTVTAADPYARVEVTRAEGDGHRYVVSVTSEDGTNNSRYEVELVAPHSGPTPSGPVEPSPSQSSGDPSPSPTTTGQPTAPATGQPTPTPTAPGPPDLPVTGSATARVVALGALLLVAGLALMVIGRRRRSRTVGNHDHRAH